MTASRIEVRNGSPSGDKIEAISHFASSAELRSTPAWTAVVAKFRASLLLRISALTSARGRLFQVLYPMPSNLPAGICGIAPRRKTSKEACAGGGSKLWK